jgi:hypothetical protein
MNSNLLSFGQVVLRAHLDIVSFLFSGAVGAPDILLLRDNRSPAMRVTYHQPHPIPSVLIMVPTEFRVMSCLLLVWACFGLRHRRRWS